MVSQNKPSLVLAFPIVPHAISFPLSEKFVLSFTLSTSRYIFEACASHKSLGICPADGEISALLFFSLAKFFQLPSGLTFFVLNLLPISRPSSIASIRQHTCH